MKTYLFKVPSSGSNPFTCDSLATCKRMDYLGLLRLAAKAGSLRKIKFL